jgi:hypothetical protein
MKCSLLLPLLLFLLFSCKEENTLDMGTISYYPSFLFCHERTLPIDKTIDLQFSEDALANDDIYADFIFVDNNDQPLRPDELSIEVDGYVLTDNILHVSNKDQSKHLTLSMPPSSVEGKHQGYLKLIDHNLNRIDNIVLQNGEEANVLQWTIYYKVKMNPLLKIIIWFIIVIASCVLLWFAILRRLFYPHFGRFVKPILIKQNGKVVAQMNCSFKGARKVVFTNRPIKQSMFGKIFKGKIYIVVNPLFVDNLVFVPYKRGALAHGNGYIVNPNPIPKNGQANIQHPKDNIQILL